jgi:DNA-binding LacI/PurR family transcriptional regulator
VGPTLEDVAARAGVSRGTASRALTGHPYVAAATRQRVLAAAADLGYRPDLAARSLAGGRGDRVAILSLVHPWSPAEDPFLAAVTAGAAEAAAAAGVGVLLRRLPVGDRAGLAELAADRRLAGLVLVNPTPAVLGALPAAMLARTVTLGGSRPDVPSVDMDNVGGARQALEHLLASGRRRITALVGPASMPCSGERLAVYADRMAAAGLRTRVLRSAPQRPAAAATFAATLAGDPAADRPDAVFAVHEEQGHAVLAVCARHGWSVPGDVEVVSFDDYPAPAGSRTYTSLSSATPELGGIAVRMVVAGPERGVHRRLPVRLGPVRPPSAGAAVG